MINKMKNVNPHRKPNRERKYNNPIPRSYGRYPANSQHNLPQKPGLSIQRNPPKMSKNK